LATINGSSSERTRNDVDGKDEEVVKVVEEMKKAEVRMLRSNK